MYGCSPKWKADWIVTEQLEKGLSILAGYIQPSPGGPQHMSLNHGLHFSGGEPFLNFELLLKAVEIAENLKIPSMFVETNCFWCTTDKFTKERLMLLKAQGLRGILISVNPFYAEFVPFERTDRCIRISLEVFGSNVMVYQLEYYRQFKQLGVKNRIAIADYLSLIPAETLSADVELFLMGRAVDQLQMFYPSCAPQRFFYEPCQPTFIRNWHNHFDNYGNFMPGFCGGISLGKWQYLDELIDIGIELEKKTVLKFIIENNFQGLKNFAENYGYHEPDSGYVSKCNLCLDIRKHLVTKEKFAELNPIEFYQHS